MVYFSIGTSETKKLQKIKALKRNSRGITILSQADCSWERVQCLATFLAHSITTGLATGHGDGVGVNI